MGKLNDWVEDSCSYYMIKEVGDNFTAIYQSFEIIPSRFDDNKDIVRYYFKSRPEAKELKMFDCGNKRLARKMDKVKKGDVIKVIRTSVGPLTDYMVEILSQQAPTGGGDNV